MNGLVAPEFFGSFGFIGSSMRLGHIVLGRALGAIAVDPFPVELLIVYFLLTVVTDRVNIFRGAKFLRKLYRLIDKARFWILRHPKGATQLLLLSALSPSLAQPVPELVSLDAHLRSSAPMNALRCRS